MESLFDVKLALAPLSDVSFLALGRGKVDRGRGAFVQYWRVGTLTIE
jgi:hypothetical protein